MTSDGWKASALEQFEALMGGLPEEKINLLVEMGRALCRRVSVRIDPGSDIVTASFERDFSGRLLLFHAMHDAALTKKTFEYFFCGASRAAGRTAVQTQNSVHAGEDAVIDGQKFSLKTEGGKTIRRTFAHISKLMEARWIRECASESDFCECAHRRIVAHLMHYERILSLRSFQTGRTWEYELVEIPRKVLLRISTLNPGDFSARITNGSSRATVRGEQGEPLFVLSMDGSVEKVTVRNLDVRSCVVHARWQVVLEV